MPSIISATTTTGLISSGDTSGSLQLATNNGTAAVTIDTSQNVGIGTASPTTTLQVNGTITAPLMADTLGGSISPISSVMRNRIINGAMVIDQRNAGASVTAVNGAYSIDRWIASSATTSAFSIQQSTTAPAGLNNSLLVTSLASTSVTTNLFYSVQQVIEGYNVADLNWGSANAKTVTVSFWVRSSLTGTFSGCVQNANVDRSYPFTYTISAANTWEKKSVTIAGDTTGTWNTTNNNGMFVLFSLGIGSARQGTANAWNSFNARAVSGETQVVTTNGATFFLTGVQLEVGTQATSFEYRQYGQELALCQRYYAKVGPSIQGVYPGFGTAGGESSTAAFGVFNTPVTMRSVPTFSSSGTLTLYSQGFSNITSFGTAYYTNSTVAININVASGLTLGRFYNILANNDTTAFIQFNSEL